MNKMLEKCIEHEKMLHKLSELEVFDFIKTTRKHSSKVDVEITNCFQQVKTLDNNFNHLKNVELLKRIEDLKGEVTKTVVYQVNAINGGPVSEGKCL